MEKTQGEASIFQPTSFGKGLPIPEERRNIAATAVTARLSPYLIVRYVSAILLRSVVSMAMQQAHFVQLYLQAGNGGGSNA